MTATVVSSAPPLLRSSPYPALIRGASQQGYIGVATPTERGGVVLICLVRARNGLEGMECTSESCAAGNM